MVKASRKPYKEIILKNFFSAIIKVIGFLKLLEINIKPLFNMSLKHQ